MRGGDEVLAFHDEAHDGGHELYASVAEMCEANGAGEARFKQTDDDWENE